MKTVRCEGFRRYGGAFTLGPVRWEQCKEKATVQLRIKQDGKKQSFPACDTCWREAERTKGMKVISASPVKKD